MCWNIPDCDAVDVVVRPLAEIFLVGFLRVFIPIARPHAPTSSSLKTKSEPTDAAEEIDKSKPPVRGRPSTLLAASWGTATLLLRHEQLCSSVAGGQSLMFSPHSLSSAVTSA